MHDNLESLGTDGLEVAYRAASPPAASRCRRSTCQFRNRRSARSVPDFGPSPVTAGQDQTDKLIEKTRKIRRLTPSMRKLTFGMRTDMCPLSVNMAVVTWENASSFDRDRWVLLSVDLAVPCAG